MAVKATRKAVVIVLCLLVLLGAVIIGLRPATQTFYRAFYPVEYWDTVSAEAEKYELDPVLVLAVIHTESRFDSNAVSHADAHGLMQITPVALEWAQYRSDEFDDVTTADLYDPQTNIRLGVYILSLLRESYPETDTMLAAYNAGYGQVAEWLADSRYS
ncbi:MAG: lytic transglycosylase domain-containing protein, partial [Clostridia bacterium]|nr:lytic transglycosylase domain-containing protein [Clostridia bacterium]